MAYCTPQAAWETHFQVQEIQVSVTACVRLVEQQRQLFDENPRLDKLALAQLINRLTTRLGQQNVVYPQLQSGAQPEYSYRFRPLVDQHRQRSRRPTQPRPQSHVAAKPLRIFNPAVQVDMQVTKTARRQSEAGSPENNGLAGAGLSPHEAIDSQSVVRRAQTIVRSWGPARIETGWWRGRTVCRDYWRIETNHGQQLWLYRDLREQLWYVQGEF